MTKQEWMECNNFGKMIDRITDNRKLRLFACAAARQVWRLLENETLRSAIIVAERFADGLATKEELNYAYATAWSSARSAAHYDANDAARSTTRNDAHDAAFYAAHYTTNRFISKNQCNLLREIVNPYHKRIIYPNLAIEIAEDIYEKQDFAGTVVLADSLEEYGIIDQELLEHLRGKGHTRGCWAIDEIRK